MMSVHLDPNRGKTTNRMSGRVNGAELPVSIRVDPIIRRPANPQTWAQKLHIFVRQFNAPQHHSYSSRVMKTLLQRFTFRRRPARLSGNEISVSQTWSASGSRRFPAQDVFPGRTPKARFGINSALYLGLRCEPHWWLYRETNIRHALSSNSNPTTIKRQPHPQHEACMFYPTPNSRRIAEAGPQKVWVNCVS
jgi:hypothetical protein